MKKISIIFFLTNKLRKRNTDVKSFIKETERDDEMNEVTIQYENNQMPITSIQIARVFKKEHKKCIKRKDGGY